jgi:hypothetical protein
MTEIECVKYHAINKGSVLGSANIYIPKWGIEIFNITLFQKDGKRWISLPSKDTLAPDGTRKFFPYFRFKNPEHFNAFSLKVQRAIEVFCQETHKEENLFDADIPF